MLVRAARRAAVASAAAPRRCTARRTSTVGDNRVVRLQTEDPRMSKIVIHNGVVYTSGQTAGDAGDCVKAQTEATLAKVDACVESSLRRVFVLNRRVHLHAIDATPARWRGVVGSSPLDGARAATSSPRNDLVG